MTQEKLDLIHDETVFGLPEHDADPLWWDVAAMLAIIAIAGVFAFAVGRI